MVENSEDNTTNSDISQSTSGEQSSTSTLIESQSISTPQPHQRVACTVQNKIPVLKYQSPSVRRSSRPSPLIKEISTFQPFTDTPGKKLVVDDNLSPQNTKLSTKKRMVKCAVPPKDTISNEGRPSIGKRTKRKATDNISPTTATTTPNKSAKKAEKVTTSRNKRPIATGQDMSPSSTSTSSSIMPEINTIPSKSRKRTN